MPQTSGRDGGRWARRRLPHVVLAGESHPAPDGWDGIIGHLVRVREDQAPAHRARLPRRRPLTPTAAQQSPAAPAPAAAPAPPSGSPWRTAAPNPLPHGNRLQVTPGYLHPIAGTTEADHRPPQWRRRPRFPPVHNLRDRIATVRTRAMLHLTRPASPPERHGRLAESRPEFGHARTPHDPP